MLRHPARIPAAIFADQPGLACQRGLTAGQAAAAAAGAGKQQVDDEANPFTAFSPKDPRI